MSDTYIVTAKTIEEAIATANRTYADAEHEISYDILEMPKKGFLGIGAKDAMIRVTVNEIRDADLASLVSDLKSMKLHTDREGRQNDAKKPKPRPTEKTADKANSEKLTSSNPANKKPAGGVDNANAANNVSAGKPDGNASGKQTNAPRKRENAPERVKNVPVEKAATSERPTSERPTSTNKKPDGKPDGNASGKQTNAPRKRENAPERVKNVPVEKAATSERPAQERPVPANKKPDGKPDGNASGKQTNAPRKRENAPERVKNVPAEKDVRPVARKSEDGAKKESEGFGSSAVKPTTDGLPKEHAEVIVSAPVGLYDLPESKSEPQTVAEPQIFAESELKQPANAEIAASEATEDAGFSEEETEKENNVKVGVSEEEMTYALEFANTLLRDMQLDARAERGACPEGETYEISEGADVYPRIEIVGDGAGILIGHHGETLDAVQYLVNLSAIRKARKANGHGDYVKIVVDVENYRTKREETLRALARRMAARAVKIKKNVFLEPMNAYERRIIHSELQSFENVSTHSVGTDRNRKIIITYDGPDRQTPASRRKPGRPEGDAFVRSERAEKAGERPVGVRNGERPRPRKPQKMPIEKLPEALPGILAAGNAEPEEILSIED